MIDPDPAGLIENPRELMRWLDDRGMFRFEPYPSGLFPASDLPRDQRAATGMGMAWLRDNAHVAGALLDAGRVIEAANAGAAMLAVLRNHRDVLRGDREGPLPVRVDGETLAGDTEPRRQNDSTGYALWLIGRLVRDRLLVLDAEDLGVLDETAGYLERIRFWEAADEGHWEEDRRVQVSSIGAAVAGLREAAAVFDLYRFPPRTDVRPLLDAGAAAISAMLRAGVTDRPAPDAADPREPRAWLPDGIRPAPGVRRFLESFGVDHRRYDAALLFLIEPLGVLTGDEAERVVRDVEDNLVRRDGVARYPGDTYWEPRFPDILGRAERTSAGEGRTERRNLTATGIAYTGTEARWTLFDPVLSVYWAGRHRSGGDPAHRDRQLRHLERSLSQIVPIGRDGRVGLPEAYYLRYDDGAGNRWVANDHTPLLWSQANLLRAVHALQPATSGDVRLVPSGAGSRPVE